MTPGCNLRRPCDMYPSLITSRGVSYDKDAGLWRSRIYCLGTFVTLGRFKTWQDAARRHDMAAYRIHGKHARTNNDIKIVRQHYLLDNHWASGRTLAKLDALASNVRARRCAGLMVRFNCSVQSPGRKGSNKSNKTSNSGVLLTRDQTDLSRKIAFQVAILFACRT